MFADIDMKNFAGEAPGPAAAVQPDTNSYQNEVQGEAFTFSPEELPQETEQVIAKAPEAPLENKQEQNFKALREEVDRMKAEREQERREYVQNLEMYRANTMQQQARSQQPEQMFGEMKSDDIPNVGELREAWGKKEAQYEARIEELVVAQQHPDYAEVVEKYATPLIKQKPHLAQGIMGAENKALYIYELGKMAQQLQAAQLPPSPPPQTEKRAQAERIVENARKPGTLSGAGGQGTLSKADYYATMSDAEFFKLAQKNLGEV